jgi:effector-binding domain-containing protein
MKTTEPKLEDRAEQPYMGIRTQVRSEEFKDVIPQLLDEVFTWLGKKGVAPAGAPIMRFHVINMAEKMDVALGVPVAGALPGDGRVSADVLPAGRYASLVYTGVMNGIAGNAALLDWGAQQGLVWDRWDDANGDAFRSRYETFLSGPEDDPDPANWDTEVAIRVADN